MTARQLVQFAGAVKIAWLAKTAGNVDAVAADLSTRSTYPTAPVPEAMAASWSYAYMEFSPCVIRRAKELPISGAKLELHHNYCAAFVNNIRIYQ